MADSGNIPAARKFAWIALICLSLFTVIAIGIQILRTDLNPLEATLSMYAIGAYGRVLTVGFFLLAAALVYLTLGIRRTLRIFNEGRIFLLFVLAAGTFLVALFPTDLPGDPHGIIGKLHNLGAYLIFFSFPFIALSLSQIFGRENRWHPIYRISWILFLIYILILIITLLIFEGLNATGYFGAFQRLMILVILIWLFVVNIQLLKITTGRIR